MCPMTQHVRSGPRSHPRRLRAVAVGSVIAMSLGLAACSGAGSEVSDSRESGQRPSATSELDREPSGGSGGSGQEDGDEFCLTLRDFAREAATADAQGMIDQLEELRELAPSDVADDLQEVEETLEELRTLSQTSGDLESFGRVLDALLDPTMRDALGAIGSYAWDECGVDIEDTWLGGGGD